MTPNEAKLEGLCVLLLTGFFNPTLLSPYMLEKGRTIFNRDTLT